MIETAGTWDPAIRPRYFLAGDMRPVFYGAGDKTPVRWDALVPVSDLMSDPNLARAVQLLDWGNALLIDSGAFSLANGHAMEYNMPVIEALALPPEQLDGFDALFDRYVKITTEHGDRAWGYVEIDIGGRERKIQTRTKLEAMGLKPIPVYHPFSDGWDYFDFLAERYDRICLANLGTATPEVRERLVATAWHRRRKYPHLWIHALGLSPGPTMLAFPMDSCDSSTWLAATRWGELRAWACSTMLWRADGGWVYARDHSSSDTKGTSPGYAMAGFDGGMLGRSMRSILADQAAAVGCDPRGTL